MTGRVDFRRIAEAARACADSLVAKWLPQGHREGHEWKALNPTRADSKIGSFSINLNTGAWADFATGDKGGDLISLLAYIDGCEQLEAARKIAQELAIDVGLDAGNPASPAAPAKRSTEWTPVLPVPEDAPEPPRAHVKRGVAEALWRYHGLDGKLLGIVYRFRTSDGGKEILPCVFAEHPNGAREWRWMAFPQPRPLYNLPALHARPTRPILVVEGEKCADAVIKLLDGPEGPPLTVVTWPGGSNAVDKADWGPLTGADVLIWPDCDAQTAKGSTELLPEPAQPGIKAAERIAEILDGKARVRIVAIPKPGEKPSGWDVADAIAEGWTADEVLAFMRNQRPPAGKGAATPRGAPAGDDDRSWRDALIWAGRGLRDCRENVIYLLREHPEWRGVIGADTFAKRIIARKASPLGHRAGEEWTPDDDVKAGLWLAEREQLLIRSTDTIRAAVMHVAKLGGFHPAREFLNGLEWDRQARLDTWAGLYLGASDTEYHRLVGRFFLINLVRRLFEPGCIMRSVPVLEGAQDKGKSTALRVLAQPWFSDTPFRVGDKDSYQQIQGIAVYEISELESFTRAEATAVKAFVSSTEDNFRAPYERQNERHPRQTVFAATTNAVEYLKDWSGNTRFWPLACGERIDVDGLGAAREQLLAEAVVLYRAGTRAYPTQEQQEQLFKPEQDRRMMSHPWQDIVVEALETDAEWKHRPFVTVRAVMKDVLRIDLAKINPQGGEAHRVGQILHAMGWRKRHQREGASRMWVWARPEKVVPVDEQAGKRDDIPF